ncbi:MAG: hypothetical protein KTR26_13880 [Flammeovirgaceae bacterium]|nr:hypothetical protein [Flammeovirgaceae bacterium]
MSIYFFLVFWSWFSCSPERPIVEPPINEFPIFNDVVEAGNIPTPELDEISGLVASELNTNYLWSHNDSGNSASLYLIDNKGELKGTIELPNLENRDWEDIAIGPGPVSGNDYLYIGNIGDNEGKYEYISIFRCLEPAINPSEIPFSKKIEETEEIKIQYPDQARDAETLIVDPINKDIYIISKRDFQVIVFKLSFPYSVTEINTLEKVGTLSFPLATGGDISKDGKEIFIRNYSDAYYWKRNTTQSVEEALAEPAFRIENYNSDKEPQGEAICFETNNKGFFTSSEKMEDLAPKLFYYSKK